MSDTLVVQNRITIRLLADHPETVLAQEGWFLNQWPDNFANWSQAEMASVTTIIHRGENVGKIYPTWNPGQSDEIST